MSTASSTIQLSEARGQSLAYLPMAWVGDHASSRSASPIVAGFTRRTARRAGATVLHRSEARSARPTSSRRRASGRSILTTVMVRMENAGAASSGRPVPVLHESSPSKVGVTRLLERASLPALVDRMLKYGLGEILLVYGPLKDNLGFSPHSASPIPPAKPSARRSSPSIARSGINIKQIYGHDGSDRARLRASATARSMPDSRRRGDARASS